MLNRRCQNLLSKRHIKKIVMNLGKITSHLYYFLLFPIRSDKNTHCQLHLTASFPRNPFHAASAPALASLASALFLRVVLEFEILCVRLRLALNVGERGDDVVVGSVEVILIYEFYLGRIQNFPRPILKLILLIYA